MKRLNNHYIRPVMEKKGFGNPQRLDLDRKNAALQATVQLICHGKVNIDQMEATFKKLMDKYLN